jgi:hypothetical protein
MLLLNPFDGYPSSLKSGGGTLQGLIQLQPQSDPIEHRSAFELELSSYPRLERTCYRKKGCLSIEEA